MSNPDRNRLLARYLTGTAGPEEEDHARKLLAEDASLRRQLEGLAADLPEFDIDAVTPIRHTEPGNLDVPPPTLLMGRQSDRALQTGSRSVLLPQTSRTVLRVVQWGAAIAAALAVVWVLLPRPVGPAQTMLLTTAPGERQVFKLGDGSQVELGVAGSLQVAGGFGTTERLVRLEGQAHFDVAPDTRRPFQIEAGPARVTVVGTKFGVRAYPGDEAVTVAVSAGRVEVETVPASRRIELRAGQAADLQKRDSGWTWVTRQLDEGRDYAWRQDRLIFRGTGLSAVAADLERFYGVTVRIGDDQTRALRLDATFEKEPLDRVARTIALALDLDTTLRNDTLVFRAHR